jgi:hypothetical protein
MIKVSYIHGDNVTMKPSVLYNLYALIKRL